MAIQKNYLITDKDHPVTGYDASIVVNESAKLEATVDSASTTVSVVVTKLQYEKGMYQPGHVTLTMSVNLTNNNISMYTLNTFLSDFIQGGNAFSVEILSSDGTTYNMVAKNYYTYSARILSGSDAAAAAASSSKTSASVSDATTQSCYVEMHLYSEDHKLTLHKGCGAWTGKKFGSQIIPSLVTSNFKCDASRLNILKTASSSSESGYDEVPLPYVIQYNEPFYDTMARMANRWGEFLYHEDGELHLGLPAEEATMPEISSRSSASTGGYNSISFSNNVNETDDTVVFENSPSTPTRGKSSTVYYDNAIADEASFELPVVSDEMIEKAGSISAVLKNGRPWVNVVSAAGKGDSVPGVLAGAVRSLCSIIAKNLFNANKPAKKKQALQGEAYTTATGVSSATEALKGKGATDLTATLDQSPVTLVNAFFRNIESAEKKARQGQVTLCYENVMHTRKLGTRVTIQDCGSTKFVITGIYGVMENGVWANNIVLTPYGDITGVGKSMPVPPIDSRPRLLTGSTQEAVVIDNVDPKVWGRVRVKFLWQPDTSTATEDATPWIRVTTPFAGKKKSNADAQSKGGMTFTPEIDSHVMVDFRHGNMELPYVNGALYDFENEPDVGFVPPLSFTSVEQKYPEFPRRALVSSNQNSLTFIDGCNPSRFMSSIIPCGSLITLLFSDKISDSSLCEGLNSDIILSDKNGITQIDLDTTNRAISINSPLGSVTMNAFTGITLNAPNGDITIKGKNVTIEAGNNVAIRSGKNIHRKNPDKSSTVATSFATTGTSLAASVSSIVLKAYAFSQTGVDLSSAFDIKFIRNVFDVFMRPVEGTLELASLNNLSITAGDGTVRNASKSPTFVQRFITDPETKRQKERKYAAFTSFCNTIVNIVTDFKRNKVVKEMRLDDIQGEITKYYSKRFSLFNGSTFCEGNAESVLSDTNRNEAIKTVKNVFIPKLQDNAPFVPPIIPKSSNGDKNALQRNNYDLRNSELIYAIDNGLMPVFTKYAETYYKYKQSDLSRDMRKLENCMDIYLRRLDIAIINSDLLKEGLPEKVDDPNFKPRIVYNIIRQCKSFFPCATLPVITKEEWAKPVSEPMVDKDGKKITVWANFINKLFIPVPPSSMKLGLLNSALNAGGAGFGLSLEDANAVLQNPFKKDRWWKVADGKGQILLSDNPKSTYYIDKTGAWQSMQNNIPATLNTYLNSLVQSAPVSIIPQSPVELINQEDDVEAKDVFKNLGDDSFIFSEN